MRRPPVRRFSTIYQDSDNANGSAKSADPFSDSVSTKKKPNSRFDVERLTDGILQRFFLHLDLKEVLALSEVSRYFRLLSDAVEIWTQFAVNLQRSAKVLVLDRFKNIESLTASELKKVVIRTYSFFENVASEEPKYSLSQYKLQLILQNFDPNEERAVLVFTENYLMATHGFINVVNYDLKTEYGIGIHESEKRVVNGGTYVDPDKGFFLNLLYVEDDLFKFSLRRMSFPVHNRIKESTMTPITNISFPKTWGLIDFSIDLRNKRFLVFFTDPNTPEAQKTILMYIIMDWETSVAAKVDTCLPYAGESSSAFGISYSKDGERLLLYAETGGEYLHTEFTISELYENASTIKAALEFPPLPLNTPKVFTFKVASDEMVTRGDYEQISGGFFGLSQITLKDTPVRAMFFRTLRNKASRNSWCVEQYYVEEHYPSSGRRCTFWLADPVLTPSGKPLLSAETNCCCWIEQTSFWSRGLVVEKRTLRLATFPNPVEYTNDAIEATFSTLDVPSEILDVAVRLNLEVEAGSIYILTQSKDLWKFKLA